MPSRNIYKIDTPETYYHIYARGASKQPIFNAQEDYQFFLSLFDRYLSNGQRKNKAGNIYPHFIDQIELLAYCLMGNHFHLLVYQIEARAMTQLMHCIMVSYSGYFNFKYKRTGALFESRYKASMVDSTIYLEHITRYIHLNPRYWKQHNYSSYRYYVRGSEPHWLHTDRVLKMFDGRRKYAQFVADYEGHKLMLEATKDKLADL